VATGKNWPKQPLSGITHSCFPGVTATRVRFNSTESKAYPTISNIGFYNAPQLSNWSGVATGEIVSGSLISTQKKIKDTCMLTGFNMIMGDNSGWAKIALQKTFNHSPTNFLLFWILYLEIRSYKK